MMKSSLLRSAAACRVALAARPLHIISRSAASAVVRAPLAATYRPANSLLRFYSSESAAEKEDSSASSPTLITKFADLDSVGVHHALVDAITRGMKYENMTDVQTMTISPALSGKDVVAQAKTGTGKTLAFLVPIINRILDAQPQLADRRVGRTRPDDIRAIIISPTRELAEQIGLEATKLVQNTGIRVQTAVGGTQKRQSLYKMRIEGCHLLVGTPGRLHDLLSDGSSGIAAPKLEALCLDEADRMLDVGFDDELDGILKALPDRRDVPRQTLLYSATMPKNVVGLARKYINPANFEFVQTIKADETPTHERVPQFIVPCRGMENIPATLLSLIRREMPLHTGKFKAIVFLPTTYSVVAYASAFRNLNYNDRSFPRVMDIHSKLDQPKRTRAATNFKMADSAILFSSDVTSRGMDFPNVTHVIQIHLPGERESYIHRIGRTGRAGKEGKGYLLVADVELPVARSRLPGLPIQKCTDFPEATAEPGNNNLQAFSTMKDCFSRIPYDIQEQMYMSFLGGACKGVGKQEMVDEVNNFSTSVFGLEEAPAVSPKMAQNLGRIRGLNIQGRDSGRFHRGGSHTGFGDNSRGGGFGRRDGGGFQQRRPRDGFEAIEFSQREQSRQSRPSRASF
ncbi:putative ATP-dependent RNA helicase mss116 [Podospora fimiseda]|uniref:ATP-dependent RNA helicase n=1 Tax=Podospora fimiseda TaxID=252190 RepID=A0AAN7BXK0_9PEZI|nr:putative ATP-dependent RNA helicase mss116 [Podospora fimiseda]